MELQNEEKSTKGVEYNGNSDEQVKSLNRLYIKIKNASVVKDNLTSVGGGNSNKGQVCRTIKSLFSSSIRFSKQIVRGVYLACTIFSNQKILLTTDEILPKLEVDETLPVTFQTDFHWLMKVSHCWKGVKELRQSLSKCLDSPTLHFRNNLLDVVMHLQNLLGIEDLGRLFYQPIKCNDGAIVVCIVKHVEDTRIINTANTKWVTIDRLDKNKNNKLGIAEEIVLSTIMDQIEYWQRSQYSVAKGLYLGYLNLKSTIDSINIIVPAETRNIVPHCLIRDNACVTKKELEWLKMMSPIGKSSSLYQFGLQLHIATKCLLQQLGVSDDANQQLKFYNDVIYLKSDVAFVLILPEIETMCTQTESDVQSKQSKTLLPIQVFEIVNMFAYQPQFVQTHCQLSLALEMDKILAHRSLRESLSTAEIALCKMRIKEVDEFQAEAENAWKSVRWVPQVMSWAREKTALIKIVVQDLYNWHDSYNNTKSQTKLNPQIPDSDKRIQSILETELSQNNSTQPSVLRVYAAYQTGLASGACVKLQVTTKTTTREVIDLVVKQLSESGEIKANGLSSDPSAQFCLVAVLGARERCLRDNFCPLQLQNPWCKGLLYVRRKRDLLAAIQQHNAVMKEQVL